MAAVDPQFGNSSGYFKDPISGQDLSPDTPRVVPCSFENGKFTWPCVMQSDGEKLLKIVYKYFTDEEKELYKAYRGRGSNGQPQVKREKKAEERPKVKQEVTDLNDREVIKHNEESAASYETLLTLAQCDRVLGISVICGVAYALVTAHNSNKVHHIPRSCIPDEEFERLMCGDVL